jgi:spermidine synthase
MLARDYNLLHAVINMPAHRSLFLVCYSVSGAAALIYQVVWVRLFGLVLGHTVASSSIVLAAFMCGLAAGSWAAGRLRLSPSTALAAYAALEALIAASAYYIPAALSSFEPVLAWAYADGQATDGFLVVRAAISFVLLGLPAAAMGATFPLAVSWFVEHADRQQSKHGSVITGAGTLYAVNTTGAAAGAIAAGFWLIPAYGLRATTWSAVALNVCAAAGALWLFQRRRPALPVAAPAQLPKRVRVRSAFIESQPALASAAAALSGFAALVFEVTWSRLIAMIIGPTTYAFAIMAASFIIGIAAGSTLGIRLSGASSRRVVWLCASLMIAAAATVLAAWFTATQLPFIIARYVSASFAFGPLLFRQAVVLGLMLVVASVAFGATFTLALATASSSPGSAARDTSRVYTANTIGAVAGALGAGFFFVPHFGLESTFLHIGRLLIATGAGLALIAGARLLIPWRSAMLVCVVALALVAGTFALPPWNSSLLAGGLYKYARGLDAESLEIGLQAGRLEYYKEGASGTVSVKTLGGTRSLAIDGKVDASNGGDMLTQRLLGLLPTLAHDNPRSALVIGLGSGVTADAVIASRTVEYLDVVEISPEVVQAASLFEPENRKVLGVPGVRLLVGDGRTHLQLTSRRYDVIVSEPSNPWMAGVAALFTREFFQAARDRLTAGGIFCQWTHTYELAAEDLRSIVSTFASVFPDGTMWLVSDGDLLLIGVKADAGRRMLGNIARRSNDQSVGTLLERAAISREGARFFLLSLYAGGPAELKAYGENAAPQSDDRMALEFTAARAMYAPPEGNAPALRALANRAARPLEVESALASARAEDWIVRGRVALKADAFGMAHDSFRRAIAMDQNSVVALRGSATAAAALEQLPQETEFLRKRAAELPRNSAVQVALSYALAMAGDMDAAMAAAVRAHDVDPESPYPLEQLASILADVGDSAKLQPVAEALVTRFPDREDSRYYNASSLFLRDRIAEAQEETRRHLARHPDDPRGHNLRGILCAMAKDLSCARSAFEASLQLNPRDAAVYANLGNIHLELAQREDAIRLFREAVAIDPAALEAKDRLRALEALD